ncbi:MAG: prepilin-type N-terminal cleavage/methylation domain-containing protein [Snodgrassella sp.]|nr:prepilin-type N-terminal cleavage/methylation domain-containing protein [Snodgrassella sp.]
MPRHNQGFTLIDMMITVTIIAILATIAYPTYNQFIIKAREQGARADLIQNGSKLERFYAKNKTFITNTTIPNNKVEENTHTLEQGKSATYFTFTGTYEPNKYRLVATPTAANSGATRLVVYDSIKGMFLCEDKQQTECNPY